MKICIDLDGVICELNPERNYSDLSPVEGAVEALRTLRSKGHYIIIHTARHMKTMDSNTGLVLASKGLITLEWLKKHQIEFDEIYFGKPWADFYIDDNALRFSSWSETLHGLGDKKD